MTRCDQELCPNWSGDGDVCPCAIFDLPRPSQHDCGHACCGERRDPHHDHFLTGDECPACARSQETARSEAVNHAE